MPAAKSKAAASSKAAAAQAEKAEKQVEFCGVTLTLPPKLPNSFGLRLAQIVGADDGVATARGVYRLLVPKYVSEETYEEIIDAVDEAGDETGLEDLMTAVVGAYGLESGESEASESS